LLGGHARPESHARYVMAQGSVAVTKGRTNMCV